MPLTRTGHAGAASHQAPGPACSSSTTGVEGVLLGMVQPHIGAEQAGALEVKTLKVVAIYSAPALVRQMLPGLEKTYA